MKGIVKTVTKNGVFNGMDKYDIEFNHTQGEKIMFFSNFYWDTFCILLYI